MRSLNEVGTLTYRSWREDRTLRLGAGLSFYSLFTLVPLVALTAALAERLFGIADIEGFVFDWLVKVGITDAEPVAEEFADQLTRTSAQSSLGLLGAGSLLFASSLVFLALDDAIQAIWHQPVRSGLRNTLYRRLVAFVMVLATIGLIVASFAVAAFSGVVQSLVPGNAVVLNDLAELVTASTSAVPLAGVLGLCFRYLPPSRVPWRVALTGGAATAIFLELGTVLMGWYLRRFGGASIAGAFGSLLALLSWVYYEMQILLAGVQLTKVLGSPHERTGAQSAESGT